MFERHSNWTRPANYGGRHFETSAWRRALGSIMGRNENQRNAKNRARRTASSFSRKVTLHTIYVFEFDEPRRITLRGVYARDGNGKKERERSKSFDGQVPLIILLDGLCARVYVSIYFFKQSKPHSRLDPTTIDALFRFITILIVGRPVNHVDPPYHDKLSVHERLAPVSCSENPEWFSREENRTIRSARPSRTITTTV